MSDAFSEPLAPPHNLEVEQCLLGTLITRPKTIEEVADFLRPEHFYEPLNNLIYSTMLSFLKENRPIDIVSIKAVLQDSSLAEDRGGDKYIGSVAAMAMSPTQAKSYGETLVDLSMRRDMIERANDLIDRCREPLIDNPAKEIMEEHEAALLKLAGTTDIGGGLVKFSDMLEMTYQQWQREHKGARGMPTGFHDLDKLLGGFHPTDLIILAGRPSMGKSALAVNIGFNAALHFRGSQDVEYKGRQVVFFSLEMSTDQLGSRIVTGQTKIIAPRNRWGKDMEQIEFDHAMHLATTHGDLPFWTDDSPEQTVQKMRARCVRLHRKKPIGLVVVDYLQLMTGDRRNQGNRTEEVSSITRGLKKLAKELQVPVLALSQLSRRVEERDNKRPVLSDLRESGSIEQDADIILFPFRPEYYLEQQGKPMRQGKDTAEVQAGKMAQWTEALGAAANKCEIAIAKQRHGPLGVVELFFDKPRTWFENLSKEEPPERLI